MKNKVIGKNSSKIYHNCCTMCYSNSETADYPLLQTIREKTIHHDTSNKSSSLIDEISNDGDGSDDDSLLDFISPEEEQRKEIVLENIRKKKSLEEAGYTLHLADSVAHLNNVLVTLTKQKEVLSDRLVIHFCDINIIFLLSEYLLLFY